MPKIKTHQGTKKRVKVTPTGKVLVESKGKGHLRLKKSRATRRSYKQGKELKGTNKRKALNLLGK